MRGESRGGAPSAPSLAPSLRASGCAPSPAPRAAAGREWWGGGLSGARPLLPAGGRARPGPSGGLGRRRGGAPGAATMAGGARLLWVSLLVLLALLRPQPGLESTRERLRVRFTPAVCGLVRPWAHRPPLPRPARPALTSVDGGAPGGAARGTGFRACECGVVVPEEDSRGKWRIPGDKGDSPQEEGSQIPCARVLGIPGLLRMAPEIPGFWGWILRVLDSASNEGSQGPNGVPCEAMGADFLAFESKWEISELRALELGGKGSESCDCEQGPKVGRVQNLEKRFPVSASLGGRH